MVNCFRGVPYKLCCTNYFKTTNIVHFDTKFGLRKFAKTSQNGTCLTARSETSISECKPFHVGSTCIQQDNLLLSSPRTMSMCNLAIRSHQVGAIDILQPCVTSNRPTRMLSNGLNNDDGSEKSKAEGTTQGRPSEEQLDHILQSLTDHLPKIFYTTLPIEDYHPQIILENNFKNKRSVGLAKYVGELSLVKILVYFKFAYCRLKILKITKHPEDGTIKVRWRIVGVPGMAVVLQFWKFRPGTLDKKCEEAPTWIDGFSIYYVGGDGKIAKHILDKMQPDDDVISSKPKQGIMPKVTLFLSLIDDHKKYSTCIINDTKENPSCLSS